MSHPNYPRYKLKREIAWPTWTIQTTLLWYTSTIQHLLDQKFLSSKHTTGHRKISPYAKYYDDTEKFCWALGGQTGTRLRKPNQRHEISSRSKRIPNCRSSPATHVFFQNFLNFVGAMALKGWVPGNPKFSPSTMFHLDITKFRLWIMSGQTGIGIAKPTKKIFLALLVRWRWRVETLGAQLLKFEVED